MNDGMLTVSNSEFGKLDILVEDGKELFPAAECARILGYSNPKDAVGRHCRGGRETRPHRCTGQNTEN